MSRLFKFFILSLFIVNFGEASTVVIGNGGEGYRIDQQIYVRDLVENSVYKNPYFGDQQTSDYIQNFDQKLLRSLNLDFGLLNQKLNDIDSVFPGLAGALVATSRLYSWSLIDEALSLLPDDGEITHIPYQERVQIANRSLLSVRFQKQIWQSMSPSHQVALFTHELIFALVQPIALDHENLIFQQSARLARQITGQLFAASTYRNPQDRQALISLMKLAFNVQVDNLKERFQLRLILDTNSGSSDLIVMNEPDSRDQLLISLTQACSSLQNFENYFLHGTLMQDILKIQPVSFESQYGSEVSAQMQFSSDVKSFKINSFQIQKNHCVESLNHLFF